MHRSVVLHVVQVQRHIDGGVPTASAAAWAIGLTRPPWNITAFPLI